jgi:TPR repeat protein
LFVERRKCFKIYERSSTSFERATDQEFANAQYNYGFFLQKGKGVSKDAKGAPSHCKPAADEGIAVKMKVLKSIFEV